MKLYINDYELNINNLSTDISSFIEEEQASNANKSADDDPLVTGWTPGLSRKNIFPCLIFVGNAWSGASDSCHYFQHNDIKNNDVQHNGLVHKLIETEHKQ